MSGIPIPQGAQIGDDSAAGIPIPQGAQIGDSPATAPEDDSQSFFPTTAAGVNKQVSDFVPGLLKGAGQTVHTVSNLINKIPGIGETLAPKAGVDALNTLTTPTTTGEKIGVGAEGLGEFLLGDEALKGLSLAEKAGILSKVAKVAETHPTIAKIIGHGLTSVRGGVATAGEELAKGASAKEAATAGVSAAALGTGVGAVAEGVGGKLLASSALKKTAQGAVPEVGDTIHAALDDAAKTAGVPVSQEASASGKALDVAKGIKAQATQTYQQLDKLSDGTYQRFRDKIEALGEAIKANSRIDPEATEKFKEQLETVKTAFQATKDDLIAKGVDPNLIKQADAKWAQGKSLEDVSKKLRGAEMLSGEMKPGTAVIDTGIKNLKPGRLDTAMGSKNAAAVKTQIIQSGKDIQAAKAELQAIRTRQKVAGAALAGLGAVGLGRKQLTDALGGH